MEDTRPVRIPYAGEDYVVDWQMAVTGGAALPRLPDIDRITIELDVNVEDFSENIEKARKRVEKFRLMAVGPKGSMILPAPKAKSKMRKASGSEWLERFRK